MTELQMIKDYINEMMLKFPKKPDQPPLEPQIYYMNGNDGTDFDWDCNDRTCEFYIFYDSKDQLGYMKVYATKRGTLEGYVFDTERYENGEPLPPRYIGESNTRRIMKWAYEEYDKDSIWDRPICCL